MIIQIFADSDCRFEHLWYKAMHPSVSGQEYFYSGVKHRILVVGWDAEYAGRDSNSCSFAYWLTQTGK